MLVIDRRGRRLVINYGINETGIHLLSCRRRETNSNYIHILPTNKHCPAETQPAATWLNKAAFGSFL